MRSTYSGVMLQQWPIRKLLVPKIEYNSTFPNFLNTLGDGGAVRAAQYMYSLLYFYFYYLSFVSPCRTIDCITYSKILDPHVGQVAYII